MSISDKEHGKHQNIRVDSIIDWKASYERPLRLWKGGFEQVPQVFLQAVPLWKLQMLNYQWLSREPIHPLVPLWQSMF